MYAQTNYLAHYGKIGMRWGFRKHVDPSGNFEDTFQKPKRKSLTTQQLGGAKGLLNNVDSAANAGKRLVNVGEKVLTKKTDLSKMSDEDLRKQVSRMSLEQSYRSLSSVDKSRGAETTRNILESVGAVVTVGSSAVAIAMGIKALRGG